MLLKLTQVLKCNRRVVQSLTTLFNIDLRIFKFLIVVLLYNIRFGLAIKLSCKLTPDNKWNNGVVL